MKQFVEETFMTFITDINVTLKIRTHCKQQLFVTEGE